MAKGFDISLKNRAASYDVDLDNTSTYDIYYYSGTKTYDISLGDSSSTHNIYLGRDFSQADVYIENIPLHLLVELAEDIAIVIDTDTVDVEIYGMIMPDANYICLDTLVEETVQKYETVENDICLDFDVEEYATKPIGLEESGIEIDMSAYFVVRRLRLLSEVDGYSLSSIDSMTLEDLTYIIVDI